MPVLLVPMGALLAEDGSDAKPRVAVGEAVILLLPPIPLVGVLIEAMRECRHNKILADG